MPRTFHPENNFGTSIVFYELARGTQTVNEIAGRVRRAQGTTSAHIQKLLRAGLLNQPKVEWRQRHYTINWVAVAEKAAEIAAEEPVFVGAFCDLLRANLSHDEAHARAKTCIKQILFQLRKNKTHTAYFARYVQHRTLEEKSVAWSLSEVLIDGYCSLLKKDLSRAKDKQFARIINQWKEIDNSSERASDAAAAKALENL